MSAMASKSLASPVFAQPFVQAQIKENIKASLAFVRGIRRWPVDHKGPVTWKIFPFDDAIMLDWLSRLATLVIYASFDTEVTKTMDCYMNADDIIKEYIRPKQKYHRQTTHPLG